MKQARVQERFCGDWGNGGHANLHGLPHVAVVVKNGVTPNWNPGKWNQGLKPAVP